MDTQSLFFSTILFVVALVSAIVTAFLWRRRNAPGGLPLAIFMLATTWWSAAYALSWADVPPGRLFWLDATYGGVVAVSPAFFVFVLHFTHRQHWLSRPVLILLIAEPILTLILLGTDSWHGLFYAGQRSLTASTIYDGGPWFWANIVYSYGLSLFAVLLLGKNFLTALGLYRRQTGLVLLSALLPWLANIISFANLNPFPEIDPTPLAFILTGIIVGFSLFYYRFLDVVPIARATLIENMDDGVLVLDTKNRIVDINPAVTRFLDVENSSIVGQKVEKFLPDWSQIQITVETKNETELEILAPGKTLKYLDIRIIRLHDRRQREQGKLIILRDVTARKQLESEREKLITTLQEALGQVKTLKGLLPICANCKKIRDDSGYWQQIEVYIHEHTEADFSHGICPDCKKKLYPEYYDTN